MNHEIIRVLEAEFPAQWPVEDKLQELGELLAVLTAGRADPRFGEFAGKLEETVVGIVSGRVVGIDPDVRAAVRGMWDEYKERRHHESYDQEIDARWGRTDEEIAAYEVTGKFEKYAIPLPRKPNPVSDTIFLSNVIPPSSLAELAQKIEVGDLEGAAAVIRAVPKDKLEANLEFERLPEIEKHRILGDQPPTNPGDDPFQEE